MENKKEICKALLPVLQMTRNLHDLADIQYIASEDGRETVIAVFDSGYTKLVNVSMDSGTAMIMDIIGKIV